MADNYLQNIRDIKRDASIYGNPSEQPDTFKDDALMQGFLTGLHGYMSGASDKPPLPSGYAGGNPANDKLMQAILDRLLNEQYYKGKPVPGGTLDPGGATVGEASGGSPWQKFKGLFS